MSPTDIAAILALGLAAGTLGGMLGVGGSVIMIPGLTFVFGPDQHLYQAAAMIANVGVSVPAAWRHYRAGSIVPKVIRWMMPVTLVCVLLGVWLSNLPVFEGRDGGIWLGRVLAVFLVYVIVLNIRRVLRPGPPRTAGQAHCTGPRIALVGTMMGTSAGLMGIGGGALAVPMQQVLLKLPLRNCIANSSAVICLSAAVGAIYKNATLAQHGADWHKSLAFAVMLSATAVVGGRLGASLTHKLPLRAVRLVFVLLMIAAAWKMAGVG
jgi:hypothetical protein